jgi:hypothetical protein
MNFENDPKFFNVSMSDKDTFVKKLGYGSLTSFDRMYKGGNPNTYGRPTDSVSMVTLHFTPENLLRSVEVNVTYFTRSKTIHLLNNKLNAEPLKLKDANQYLIDLKKLKIIK